jgi:FtsZ-binding cell division protein ZapB
MAMRCFMSRQETREKLEQYEDQLKRELAGVRERMQELQGS